MKKIYISVLASARRREALLYLVISSSFIFVLVKSALHDADNFTFSGESASFFAVLINTFIYVVPFILSVLVGSLGVGIMIEESGKSGKKDIKQYET